MGVLDSYKNLLVFGHSRHIGVSREFLLVGWCSLPYFILSGDPTMAGQFECLRTIYFFTVYQSAEGRVLRCNYSGEDSVGSLL